MASFDVNDKGIIQLTDKLERLHKSAFPSAVRNTLNNLAFETKENIPKVAGHKFITRNKSFFKSFSVVDKASGFDVNKMQSIAGINSAKGSKVAEGLEKQETGGSFKGRKLLNHDDSRVSKSSSKKVAVKGKHGKSRIHNANPAFRGQRGSRGSKFMAAVMATQRRGMNAMLLSSGGRGIVYGLKGLSSNLKTKKVKFKAEKLFVYRSDSTTKVKKTSFISDSANLAAKNTQKFYKKNAEFQFKKHLK